MASIPATASVSKGLSLDRRFALWLGGAVLLIIVLVSVIAPTEADKDPRPSSLNSGPAGTKAAFLTLEALGRPVGRWDAPLSGLEGKVDPSQTTLVIAEPQFTALNKEELARDLTSFLERGGRVVITGSQGALLLPGGATRGSNHLSPLCYTTPAGPGPLARAGSVELTAPVFWNAPLLAAAVDQRCGTEPVVVRLPVGAGEAVWWSSAAPMTNAELHNDADLRLFLLSIGADRRVLFDEDLLDPVSSPWTAARGLPLWWMAGQIGVLFLLMVFSLSRRREPIRLPGGVPRSSPLEFARSMGDLYQRAKATAAATEAARRRLERVLVREAHLSEATLREGPEAIQASLTQRFGGSWSAVTDHLLEARAAAGGPVRVRSAVRLVRALGEDGLRVRAAARGEAGRERDMAIQPPGPGPAGRAVAGTAVEM